MLIYRHKHELKNQPLRFHKMSSCTYFSSKILPRAVKYCQLVCEKFSIKMILDNYGVYKMLYHKMLSFDLILGLWLFFIHILLNIEALKNIHTSKKFYSHKLFLCYTINTRIPCVQFSQLFLPPLQ